MEKPGGKKCGSITYGVYYYCTPKLVTAVPNTCFIPSPKVDSSVIHLDIKRLKGIPCGYKSTSCPDQMAKALEEIQKKIG